MKKYLLGFTAIVLAIGFSAFTKPVAKKGKFTNYDLRFQDVATSSSNVQDLTKWTTQTGAGSCSTSGTVQFACKVLTVSDIYTHDTLIDDFTYQTPNRTGSIPNGESAFGTITATSNGSPTLYYVSAAGQGTISNALTTQ